MLKSCQLNCESGKEGSCESFPTVNICPVQSETQNTIENLTSNWLESWSSQIISEVHTNPSIIPWRRKPTTSSTTRDRNKDFKAERTGEKEDHPGRNLRIRRLQTKEPHRWT